MDSDYSQRLLTTTQVMQLLNITRNSACAEARAGTLEAKQFPPSRAYLFTVNSTLLDRAHARIVQLEAEAQEAVDRWNDARRIFDRVKGSSGND